MHQHAQATYPEECCGLIIGALSVQSRSKDVRQIHSLANQWMPEVQTVTEPDGVKALGDPQRSLSRRRRYWINPKDLLVAQREARDRGWVILGIYHSHPDHPAVPSECDRALAWPEYSYVILSVHQGTVVDCQSWRLDDQHQFQPEPIQIKESSDC
ncbi:MAG: M67 family metallopeptidase [Leptolyngbyaceae cyanobacterium]